MLVGAFLHEPVDRLRAGPGLAPVAELAAVSAQPVAQCAVFRRHRLPRLAAVGGILLQDFARTRLGGPPRRADGPLQFPAQVPRERRHGPQAPATARPSTANSRSQCPHRCRTVTGSITASRSPAWRIL